jgi:[acyl-carrier-protein] S-malonyltransferase
MTGRVAWLFPGQGSQHVGMGKQLAERFASAAHVFDEASDALGLDVRKLAWDAAAEELDQTVNAQPALLVSSIAALRSARQALGHDLPDPVAVAGHSLGEYSAIVAAGALSLADGARIVRTRGELMQAVATENGQKGAMAAVIGLDAGAIGGALEGGPFVIANDNAPGQVVISGPADAVGAVTETLKSAGAKRVIPLRVSGAFHSPALRSVAPKLAAAIARARWDALRYPVIANVDAQAHEHARDLPALLERQVFSPVRWVDVIRRADEMGATAYVEFGAGSVLTSLVKRIVPGARTGNVSDAATLEASLPLFH